MGEESCTCGDSEEEENGLRGVKLGDISLFRLLEQNATGWVVYK